MWKPEKENKMQKRGRSALPFYCRKIPLGFSDKEIAARRAHSRSATDRSHTCGLSGIFSDVHAAGKNDSTSSPPAGGELCEAFVILKRGSAERSLFFIAIPP